MMTIFRAFIVVAFVGGTVFTARAQQPPRPKLAPVTDAEILATLQGQDMNATAAVMLRAEQLPPHTLRSETVVAIGKEIVKVESEGRARFESFLAGKGPQPKEEDGYFDYVSALSSVLVNQENPAGIDGLVEVADVNGDALDALVGYGDAAVPALVGRARAEPWRYDQKTQKAMDALEQMLESKTIGPKLSASSRTAIRQLAADRLHTLKGDENWRNFAAAAYLAVATGDSQLRKEVEELNNNDRAFFLLGMNTESQRKTSELIQQALDKFPN